MAWMVIFTDLVSLMLTFFVLIFSMSSVKVDKWKEMTDALSQNLNPSITKSAATATAKFNISTIFRKRAINLDYLTAVLERAVNQDPLLKRSLLMRLEDRLIIALPGDLLFQSGRAVMTERARDALFTLGGVLRNIGNQIGVNGHSDPAPPKGGEYTSNWELSIARAVAVTNALKRSGYTEDIIAYGYSDSLYSQLPNVTEEQRQAMGRRVDIMVLPNVGD
ncbi:MAG TPA: OmpA family protein [Rhodospirillaceae bacterium]|jgi:chemotaxis protein MotB|nr:OmpA family protein [Rhodospirillaceae bacterium]HIJ44871.1 OmpA family protein [Rhodospirillaceae bacterium]HIJ93242.1 OmpA family protein [Rhodospirillaceae bacterium]